MNTLYKGDKDNNNNNNIICNIIDIFGGSGWRIRCIDLLRTGRFDV